MQPSGQIGPSDIEGMRAYSEELQARFEKLTVEAPAIQAQARAIQITEKSPDGLISATVGAGGELIRLDLDPRIYRRPDSRELADTITETVKAAKAKVQDRVLELFEPLVPREEMTEHMNGSVEDVLERMTKQMLGKG